MPQNKNRVEYKWRGDNECSSDKNRKKETHLDFNYAHFKVNQESSTRMLQLGQVVQFLYKRSEHAPFHACRYGFSKSVSTLASLSNGIIFFLVIQKQWGCFLPGHHMHFIYTRHLIENKNIIISKYIISSKSRHKVVSLCVCVCVSHVHSQIASLSPRFMVFEFQSSLVLILLTQVQKSEKTRCCW